MALKPCATANESNRLSFSITPLGLKKLHPWGLRQDSDLFVNMMSVFLPEISLKEVELAEIVRLNLIQ
jgi:hypothetical protein